MELSSDQAKYLSRYSLRDVATVLERTAENMFAANTLDNNNFMLDTSASECQRENLRFDCSGTAASIFLAAYTPFWRARFYRVIDKVNAYLIAAAEARLQHKHKQKA